MALHTVSNSVYVLGRTNPGIYGLSDVVLLKYNMNLDLLWNTTWGGSANDDACDVVVSSDGSAFVAAYTESWGAGNADMVLLKYYPNGTLAWNKTWGTTDDDYAIAIASDEANGALYVMGQTTSVGVQDLILTKFYWNGTYAWSNTWGGPYSEYPRGLIIGNDGALYASVMRQLTATPTFDIGMVKFTTSGAHVWNVTWGHEGYDELAAGLVQDAAGNLYIGGYSDTLNPGYQLLLLLKFNQTGGLVWNLEYGGGGIVNTIEDITIDAVGNVYALGYTDSFGAGVQSWIVLKYNPDGVRQWYLTSGSPNYCWGDGIAVAANGDLFFAGFYQTLSAATYIAVLKYSPQVTAPSQDYTMVIISILGIGFVIALIGWIIAARKYTKDKPKRKTV